MTFLHWTGHGGGKIEVPEQICSQAVDLWPRHDVRHKFRDNHVEDQFFVVALDEKVKACAHAGVYVDTIFVPDQPGCEESKFRYYWISHIVSHASPGVASQLLQRCEEYLKSEADKRPTSRRNYYVYTIPSATGFYLKNGYVAIHTPDHDDNDEECCYTWQEHLWMAKGMDTCLDRETDVDLPVSMKLALGLPVIHHTDKEWYTVLEDIKNGWAACDYVQENYRPEMRRQILERILQVEDVDLDVLKQEWRKRWDKI